MRGFARPRWLGVARGLLVLAIAVLAIGLSVAPVSVLAAPAAARVEVVFLDTGVPDYRQLLDDLRTAGRKDTEYRIALLDASQDGLRQINSYLGQLDSPVDAIHFITFGADHAIKLGSTWIDAVTLADRRAEIQKWAGVLSPGADVLAYGCNVAQSDAGRRFVRELSRLTGADVASSVGVTGNSVRGGDWELEYHVGQIETAIAVGPAVQRNWQGLLDITTGLKGHWKLDADANDFSGNSYHGVLTNGAAIDTNAGTNRIGPGKVSLDGVDDYVDLSVHVGNFAALTQGTISAWIKTSDTDGVIFDLADTADVDSFASLWIVNGKFAFDVAENNSRQLYVKSADDVSNNAWRHVAVTVGATGNKLYLDGVLQASPTYSVGNASTQRFFNTVTGLDFMAIGIERNRNGFRDEFAGLIDDVRVYDRALSAADITELFAFPSYPVSGKVFEDIAGDALLDGAIGGANNPGVASAAVSFYLDNGNGTPGAGDTLVVGSPVTTGADGSYTSPAVAPGNYWVVVNSKTVASSQDPVEPVANLWAEQTYGAAGARCSNGAGGTATLGSPGACYGGQRGAQSDDLTSLAAAEHVTGVTVAAANVTGIDFGFSFKVVTTARDGDDDGAAANRWVQGSLRQFLQNSNAIGVADAMRFVPAVATNASGSGGNWWQVALTGTTLPVLSNAGTTVDGTAYCAFTNGTQGCTALTQVRDPNPGTAGNPDFAGKSVGTGADGIEGTADDPQLPNYDRPELEVNGNDLGVILRVGASAATIRRLAFINYDSVASGYAILVSGGTGSLVTESFLGPRADGIDPGVGLRLGYAVNITTGTADVTKCFIGYTEGGGIFTANAALVQENDIYRNGISRAIGDGVSIEDSTGQAITVRQNRIDRSAGYGVEGWKVPGPYAVENNTVSRSGQGGGVERGGLRVFGTGSSIRSNVVTSSAGAGIVVVQRSDTGPNRQNQITKNAIYGNGAISIDLDVTNTGNGNPNGDGVTPNDGTTDPNLPNIAMDYPVITSASLKGSNLNVLGYVGTAATKVAGVHTIELFKAANDGNNNGPIVQGDGLSVPHGEARWFLNSCTTAADGTFDCNVAVPGAVPFAVGDPVVGTATNATGSTSEVGANVAAVAAPVPAIVKRAILLDGTPLADGVTVPRGTRIKFLLYINNTVGAIADVSLVDTLDPGFAYIASSIRTSNTFAACAALACTPAEEAAIFAAANAGAAGSDAVDADTVSFTGGVVRAGNQAVANAQLDIAGVRVYALVFTVRVQ